ncbi:MAG: hypothetical protein D6731_19125 [Planctomycetota bacterium]|nr:MAG: hypothetical protein D6731_19125 [Planctomycetota bacterium]
MDLEMAWAVRRGRATPHERNEAMKKMFVAAFAALALTGASVFACGGMTQIDPPSLQLDAGPDENTVESIIPELSGIVILC